jgi:hypothetical protein
MSASFRYLLLTLLGVFVLCFFSSSRLCSTEGPNGNASTQRGQDRTSLLLDEGQCSGAFPLLNKEIDDAVAAGPFSFKRAVDDYTGQTHGRIKDGKVRTSTEDCGGLC